MLEALNEFLADCVGLPVIVKYLIVVAIGMLPVFEIRGALPAGIFALGLGVVETFICGIIGNIILIIPVVVLGRKIVRWLETTRVLGWFGKWLSKRTENKIDKVQKATSLMLFFFVAIPIPGTGVFTAGTIASFMDLRLKRSFTALALGVLAAGIVSMFLYVLPFAGGDPTALKWF